MNYKILLLFSIVFIISISAVSATDGDDQSIVGEYSIDLVSAGESLEDLGDTNGIGTFTELQPMIWRVPDGGTLTLDKDYAYDESFSRGINGMSMDNNITIDGNGYTIDGKNSSRIFYISPKAKQVTFINVNFINAGGNSGGGGGAIFSQSSLVIIKNCTFTNNRIDMGSGGAVCADKTVGTIISDSVFTGNHANDVGGAISVVGNKTLVENCIFIDNDVTNSLGGAVLLFGNDNVVRNNLFENNFAGRDGGALDMEGSTHSTQGERNTITNNTFIGNRAKFGGALGLNSVNVTVSFNTFINNSAIEASSAAGLGGAIRLMGEKNEYDTTGLRVSRIFNNTFINNYAYQQGGAVYYEETNLALFDNTFMGNNVISERGGTINAIGAYSTISNNYIADTSAKTYGGAIFTKGSNIKIVGNVISNANANDYGGAINIQGSSPTITDNEISSSCSGSQGGAIFLKGDGAVVDNNIFDNNYATTYGGALLLESVGATITNNKFNNNIAKGRAGAINMKNSANTIIRYNTFDRNTGENEAGAIYNDDNNVVVEGNVFIGNKVAGSGSGGAIRWNYGDGAIIKSNTFKDNTAPAGFAIFGTGSKQQITKNIFIGGKSTDDTVRWGGARVGGDNIFTGDGDIYTPVSTTIVASNVETGYNSGENITATLIDVNGNTIWGADVKIKIGSIDKTLTTDKHGKVSLSTINLESGIYTAVISFIGNDIYKASKKSITVKIICGKSELIASDVLAEYGDVELFAILTDEATGKGINGANVMFVVNDMKYAVKTNSNGEAKLTVSDLAVGTYTAIVSFEGDKNYNPSNTTADIVVNKIITSISLYYDSTTNELVATLINTKTGKGISGGNVVFKLNGVKYIVKSKSGEARLSMGDVDPDTFNATASYGGNFKYLRSAATIRNIAGKMPTTISNAYDKENNQIIATLINVNTGNPIKGANVVINLAGMKKVTVKTDKQGQAIVSIGDLNPGVLTITSSYGGNSKYSRSLAIITIVKP